MGRTKADLVSRDEDFVVLEGEGREEGLAIVKGGKGDGARAESVRRGWENCGEDRLVKEEDRVVNTFGAFGRADLVDIPTDDA